ncbi:MAG TPA: type VI secretion system-associated FHA domain protein TagH [Vicinamibacterales bacterium]|nr:type VI secretion system-associated FHA domain protein TagH [Vicinamibacterales bacterium]
MILTLEVTGPQEGAPRADIRKVFEAAGGTIGRLPDNDWVLPDPYVSSRHARIRFQNGAFLIEDTSTNGVFINSPDNRLVRGQPYTLKSGDRIFIEPYEIRASITAPPMAAADPFGLEDPFTASAPSPRTPDASPFVGDLIPGSEDLPSGEVDPLSLLGFDGNKQAPPNVPRAADLARDSVLRDYYKPPVVPIEPEPAPPASASSSLIPDDYDPLASSAVHPLAPRPAPVAPRPAAPAPRSAPDPSRAVRPSPAASPAPRVEPAPPRRRQAPAASGGIEAALAEVLKGAGVEGAVVTPELAQHFGEILRVVVAGVMDVLQARQRIKDEFRMRVTTFKTSQNNPLKFSANVEDALHNLLVKRNPAYLGPVESFEDAFDDIRNHQMAMLAGVRVAFEAMLSEFNPERLQEEFDRLGKGSIMPGKLRYWDLYRDKFSDMVSDAEASFRELFGEEFAKAYEEQLERLKAQGRERIL